MREREREMGETDRGTERKEGRNEWVEEGILSILGVLSGSDFG